MPPGSAGPGSGTDRTGGRGHRAGRPVRGQPGAAAGWAAPARAGAGRSVARTRRPQRSGVARRARIRWRAWLAAAAAAMILALSWSLLADHRALAPGREALLRTATDAVVLPWQVTTDPAAQGTSGDVVWSTQRQRGFLRFRHLAPMTLPSASTRSGSSTAPRRKPPRRRRRVRRGRGSCRDPGADPCPPAHRGADPVRGDGREARRRRGLRPAADRGGGPSAQLAPPRLGSWQTEGRGPTHGSSGSTMHTATLFRLGLVTLALTIATPSGQCLGGDRLFTVSPTMRCCAKWIP